MTANSILKEKGIKITQNRLELLEVLEKSENPINPKEIEKQLNISLDRVTLYRNLKFFVDNKIVHKIEVNGSITTYSLNRSILNKAHSNSEHLHFHCNLCDGVTCMPQCKIKEHDLPKGFVQQSSQLIVNGICNVCSKNNDRKAN